MSASSKTNTLRFSLATLVAGIVALLAFTNVSSDNSLRKLAGSAAFRTNIVTKQVRVGASIINYTATSGYLKVGGNNSHTAQLFYTAYTSGKSNRPVTFVFNGGPGSSSIWLHMGSFGPVRTVAGKAGYSDNPDTWLGFTDLVFIDPVGTGYSRPEDGTDARRFYSYQADIHSVGQFIQQYLTQNNRQQSSLFLAGESYGAARAVGLAGYLKDSLNINTKGLTLISPALDYKLISFRKNNDTPYPYYLSAYAATAQYHKRLSPAVQGLSAQALVAKVNSFAFGTYRNALAGKQALSAAIIDTLSLYTGLDTTVIKRANGRISDTRFARLLFASTEKITGTYDSRDTGKAGSIDPSEQKLREVFPEAFTAFNKQVLGYQNNLPYLATVATPNWNYGKNATNGFLNVTPELKKLIASQNIQVQIVSGKYDLATPAATVNQLVANLGSVSNKVSVLRYNAGHMIYTDDVSNHQWHSDSEKFYEKAMVTR